jgi:hypothetical protein
MTPRPRNREQRASFIKRLLSHVQAGADVAAPKRGRGDSLHKVSRTRRCLAEARCFGEKKLEGHTSHTHLAFLPSKSGILAIEKWHSCHRKVAF